MVRSRDGGESWTDLTPGLSEGAVFALRFDPAVPTTIYAGANEGIFRSTDASASWSAFGTGLACGFVRVLEIEPAGTVLHAGTTCGTFDYEIVPRPGA